MSTSNLVDAIGELEALVHHVFADQPTDSAFVDRADIVQFIDLPSREAIYEILRTCLCEIIAKGVVAPTVRTPLQRVFIQYSQIIYCRRFPL